MQWSSPRASSGFSRVAGVHGALGRPRAHDRMQLVDEEDDLALRVRHGLEHRLEPLLELAAILGAGDQRAHVERHDALLLQALGHVPPHDPLGQPLHDRGLADARRADQHGVVLGAARQNLDDAPDLLVAADDRVELALLGERGEIPTVLLEGLVGALGSLARHPLAAPDGGRRLEQLFAREAGRAERLGHRAVLEVGEGQEQVLHADVLVLHALSLGLGPGQDLIHTGRDVHLARGSAGSRHAGQALERLLEPLDERRRVPAGLLDDAGRDAAVLAEQRRRQVFDVDLGMAPALRQRLRPADHVLSLLGQSVEIHRRRSLCRHASAGGAPAPRQPAACTTLSVIAPAVTRRLRSARDRAAPRGLQ